MSTNIIIKTAGVKSPITDFLTRIWNKCITIFGSKNKIGTEPNANRIDNIEMHHEDGVWKFLQSKKEEAKRMQQVYNIGLSKCA